MPSERAQNYLRQLVNGLAHIHSLGIVHRDIKPENLLLTQDGKIRVGRIIIQRDFLFYKKGPQKSKGNKMGLYFSKF